MKLPSGRLHSTPVRVAGASLVAVAAGMWISAAVALIDGGGSGGALFTSGLITGVVGAVMLFNSQVSVSTAPALSFAAVAWSWLAVSLAGALPYVLSGTIRWAAFDAALYEAISGFTCSGSTILADVDSVAHGLVFFRQMSHWFGGMGLIVLAVAVLPALRVGGLELIASEAPGPTADPLAPRVSETARRLWLLYGGATLVVTAALLAAGLSPFDAVGHAFSTVATGGFSTRTASVAHFDSFVVELILVCGMLYCGANFAMHWHLLTGGGRNFRGFGELRWYLGIFATAFVVVVALRGGDAGFAHTARETLFWVASLGTSTGFATTDYTAWVPGAQMVLLLLMLMGGMTGSTAGGMKVMRLQLAASYALREVVRARHPRAVVPVRLGSMAVGEQVVARAIGFVLLYLALIIVGGVVVTAMGSDPLTGFSGAVSALAGMGPALGDAGPLDNALAFTRQGRGVLMTLMMFGRLELFPAMLMFAASSVALSRARRAPARR